MIDLDPESEFSTVTLPSNLETVIPSHTETVIPSGAESDTEVLIVRD